MSLNNVNIGFAMTGSFCTFSRVLKELKLLAETGAHITPILSYNAASTDTRFMSSLELFEQLKDITQRPPILTLNDAEPIGPKKLFDLIIVAPCTGNTLAKIANAVTDTPVTLAVKSHLRNCRPVLLAVSSNDALGANAKNLGLLLNAKHMYFVPFGQDDYKVKVNSLVSDMGLIISAAEHALKGEQLQPVLISN